MENDKIEIYFRKWVFFLTFLVSVIFVILGIFIIFLSFNNDKYFTQEQYQLLLSNPFSRFMYNPVTEIFFGTMSVLFFGFAAIVFFRILFYKKPGLVIDNTGIIYSTSSSAKYILWENITGIKSYNLIIVRGIIIVINNPNEYIERYKNIVLKIMAKIDTKIQGSPIYIPTDVLKCKHKELVKILRDELEKRKNADL